MAGRTRNRRGMQYQTITHAWLSVLAALLTSMGAWPAKGQLPAETAAPRSLQSQRFRFVADGPVRGGFALDSGKLVFGTEAGSFYALDSRDGSLRWRQRIGSSVGSVPLVEGGRVYLSAADNALHALDLETGTEAWRRNLGKPADPTSYWDYYQSSPVMAGGNLYVGGADGNLYSVDPRTGRTIWCSHAGGRVRTTPAIASDRVLVGTTTGYIVAFDRLTGKQLWKFKTQGGSQDFSFKDNDTRSIMTAPTIAGDVVIAGGRDGNLYGLNLATGEEQWRATHDGASWILGLATDKERFYSGSGSAFIVQAAEVATGKEIWRTPTANAMFGGICKAGDVLVSNGIKGTLFGFDASSGAQLWRFRLAAMAFSRPLIADGAVFTGADDGLVYGINTGTDKPIAFERLVYSYTDQPAAGFFWFTPETLEGIKGSFAGAGYKIIGSAELLAALSPVEHGAPRKIVVVADTRLPDRVDPETVRRFINSGGVLVLIGPNPFSYTFDEKGAPATQDESKGAAVFGMTAADRERDYGYNVSTFTTAAKPLGLTGQFVSLGLVAPDQVSSVLAQDRAGMATAWTKRFTNGGLLLNLPVTRNRPVDLSAIINAIDFAALAEARKKAQEKEASKLAPQARPQP
jgi:eukaryotic-like serine/threonine-protein kinase